MIEIGQSAAVLLASGFSSRFGQSNKLLAPLRGKPLVAHAAELVGSLPFRERVAVVAPRESSLRTLLAGYGFRTIENPEPGDGQESSLRLGLQRALLDGPTGIVVLLGDMPNLSSAHIEALAAAAGVATASVSIADGARMPPVLLPAAMARQVLAGTRPLRDSLGNATEVPASGWMLRDYDTAADFDGDRLEGGP